MAVQFILGGSGRGKTYYLQHLVAREAALFPARRYIYVVPEQFTMQTQRAFAAISEKGGILNIEVQSFLRLAFRVFSETGSCRVPVLDDMGKTMVLKKVLESIEKDLAYFGGNVHKKGYVQEIKSFLSELFQYGASEETLDEMIAASKKHPLLERKLVDMKVIYRAFCEYMENHYITAEEVLTVFAQVAPDSAFLKDSVICLDGFTGFTPTQYRLLQVLMNMVRKVYVTITLDERVSLANPGPKHGLFYMSRQTLCRIRKMAQESKVELCDVIWTGEKTGETRFAGAPELDALERNLYRYPMETYEEEVERVSLHLLRQPEDEINFAAEKIRGLLLDGKCRYRDIAVITGNLEVYGMLAGELFAQAGIPCFVDQKKSILENPFVEFLDVVLNCFLSNFAMEKVMVYERNLFSSASSEQCDWLDNFLRATGLRGYRSWQETWSCETAFYGMNPESMREAALLLDTIRVDTLACLEELYEAVAKGKHSVREYAQALCEWMEREEYYVKIRRIVEQAEAKNELAMSREYSQIYEIVLEVLDRLVSLLGDEVMDLREFKEILDTGFSEARIGLIPPGVDQVVVGDRNRTRLTNVQYLFFLGVNDSNIPQSGSHGGVISDSERLFLVQEEFELAPTVRDAVYTDQFYLYLSLTKPSKHLYLSWCETGNDGKAQNPAYIVSRIQKLFPKLSVCVEQQRRDERYLLGNTLGKDYLIEGLRRRDFSDSKWQEIYCFYCSQERKQQLLPLLQAAFYRELQTPLSRRVVRELYRDVPTESTSQLERYAACAFSYFMRYGLHLQERAEHQVAFFDIGNIVHEALELYTRRLIREGKRWEEIPEAEQRARSGQCIDKVVERYKSGLLYSTKRDTYLITRLKSLLERSIWAITRQMEQGCFRTVDSEVSFELLHVTSGRELEQEREDGQMRLIGRIDRVDGMEEDGAYYIKIIDYKTGKKNISLSDLYYGLQMQLMIYLKAGVEEKRHEKRLVVPAGMFYYHIDNPIIEGKEDKEQADMDILRELRMDGLVNEDSPVLPALDISFWTESGELMPATTSWVAPFATNKNGTLKKTSKAVTTRDFELLMDFTGEKLLRFRDEIMAGKIDIYPYRKADSSGEIGCQYCPYHGVCQFDARIEGNRYHILEKLSDDDVMRKVAQEQKKENEGGLPDEREERAEMDEGTAAGH